MSSSGSLVGSFDPCSNSNKEMIKLSKRLMDYLRDRAIGRCCKWGRDFVEHVALRLLWNLVAEGRVPDDLGYMLSYRDPKLLDILNQLVRGGMG